MLDGSGPARVKEQLTEPDSWPGLEATLPLQGLKAAR